MRARERDRDESRELRPKPARLDALGSGPVAQAATAGRWDVVGTDGLLGLQRTAGNHGVAAALRDDGWQDTDPGSDEPSPVHDVISSGGGQPLDAGLRADMEARLGHDFGDVRVHHDARAEESARSVNAHAYTVGSNIVFQRDRYDPSSDAGRITLAHELTHVIQQRSGPVDGTSAPGGIRLSDPSDRFEREAAANAERVMSAPAPAISGRRTSRMKKRSQPPSREPSSNVRRPRRTRRSSVRRSTPLTEKPLRIVGPTRRPWRPRRSTEAPKHRSTGASWHPQLSHSERVPGEDRYRPLRKRRRRVHTMRNRQASPYAPRQRLTLAVQRLSSARLATVRCHTCCLAPGGSGPPANQRLQPSRSGAPRPSRARAALSPARRCKCSCSGQWTVRLHRWFPSRWRRATIRALPR